MVKQIVLGMILLMPLTAISTVRSCHGCNDRAEPPAGAVSEPAPIPQPAYRISYWALFLSLL